MFSKTFKSFRYFLAQLNPKGVQEKARKLWIPAAIVVLITLPPLLFKVRESTLFPLSIKARDWTGFGDSTTEGVTTAKELAPDGKTITKTVITDKKDDGKTLWDWLSVLGVPLTLVLLGALFQSRQQTQADKKANIDKEIAEEARREEVIQTYLDKLSELLVDKNLIALAEKIQSFEAESKSKKEESKNGSEGVTKEVKLPEELKEQKEQLGTAVNVIRARTLAVLRRLKDDPERKGSVIWFLIEAEVIQKLKLSLNGADLSHANLYNADLSYFSLRFANLSNANLNKANLREANLSGADLSGADLSHTYLRGADLCEANLSGADLCKANLKEAILVTTKLHDSNNLIQEQLEVQPPPLLCNVALPEGINIDRNRDCSDIAEVLCKRYPKLFKIEETAQKYVNNTYQNK